MSKLIRRPLHPEIRIMDEAQGLVEYVASDETLDSYQEIIRASGWRFSNFEKNAPFVDSHTTYSMGSLLGRVVSFEVKRKRLVEVVKWAIDVPDNRLAQLGFQMTKAGYAKAVSVGFWPIKAVSKWDADQASYQKEVEKLGLEEDQVQPRTIYLEQEQLELSAVIVGANPNAIAKAFKASVLSDADLDFLSDKRISVVETADEPDLPATVRPHPRQAARLAFYLKVREIANHL